MRWYVTMVETQILYFTSKSKLCFQLMGWIEDICFNKQFLNVNPSKLLTIQLNDSYCPERIKCEINFWHWKHNFVFVLGSNKNSKKKTNPIRSFHISKKIHNSWKQQVYLIVCNCYLLIVNVLIWMIQLNKN